MMDSEFDENDAAADDGAAGDFEFLTTEKGKRLLHAGGGYLYWNNRRAGNRTYWRCVYFQKGAPALAPAVATVDGDDDGGGWYIAARGARTFRVPYLA